MNRQNTKFTLGRGKFVGNDLPAELAGLSGLLAIPTTLDPNVGKEVALHWFDPTPFIHDLASLRPFQVSLRTGLFSSAHGPLMWLLFYVSNPRPEPQPFASVECHINPHDERQVATWRRLANQTHWHVILHGEDDTVVNLFEFANDYGLLEALDTMERACRGMRVTDFSAAKQEFWDTYTLGDLYRMD